MLVIRGVLLVFVSSHGLLLIPAEASVVCLQNFGTLGGLMQENLLLRKQFLSMFWWTSCLFMFPGEVR